MTNKWRTAFLLSIVVLVLSNALLGFGLYKAVGDGIALSYLQENQHDCQVHRDFLHSAARGRLTKEDFQNVSVFVVRNREGKKKIPVSQEMFSMSFDPQGRYLSSSFATSAPSE